METQTDDIFDQIDEPGDVELPDEPPALEAPEVDEQPAGDDTAALGESADGGESDDVESGDSSETSDGSRQVPLATLMEERKKLQSRIEALESQVNGARDEGKQELLNEIRALRQERAQAQQAEQQAAKDAEPELDYLDDPKGYTDRKVDTLLNEIKELKQGTTQLTQAQQQQQIITAVANAAATQEHHFVTEHSDYYEALSYSRQKVAANLQLQYPTADAQAIQAEVQRLELATAAQVLQRKGNVPEFVYQYAKNLGYTGPAKDDTAQETDASKDAEAEQMRLKREKASTMQGGSVDDDVNDLLDADEDEFAAVLADVFGKRGG